MSGEPQRQADLSDDVAVQLLDLMVATLDEPLSPAQRRAYLASVEERPNDPPPRLVRTYSGAYTLARAPRHLDGHAPVVRVRRSARAPRRASASKGASVAASGADGPPEPPASGPLVHQGTSGLPRRRFLKLVRERAIPHARIGRLVVVRLDDLYRALGLTEAAPAAPSAPAWSPEAVRLRILAGGKAGAR